MNHHTDPNQIERDIDRDRSSLASTLNALQDKVTVENLAQGAFNFLRANSAGYTKSFDHAVRANPLAVALVGTGVAWLVFGNRKSGGATPTKLESLSNWEDDGGPARASDDRLSDLKSASLPRPRTGRMMEDHPMVTGAASLAMGAVLGAVLSRTTP